MYHSKIKVSQDQKNLLALRLSNLKRGLKALEDERIIPLIEKWEGKFYNKRFLTAFNTILADYDVTAYLSETSFKFCDKVDISIKFYDTKDRCIKSVEVDRNGYSHYNYIDTSIDMLTFFDRNNKMKAEEINERLNSRMNHLKTSISSFEKALSDIDNIVSMYNEKCEEINAFNDKLDYNLSSFLNMKL